MHGGGRGRRVWLKGGRSTQGFIKRIAGAVDVATYAHKFKYFGVGNRLFRCQTLFKHVPFANLLAN